MTDRARAIGRLLLFGGAIGAVFLGFGGRVAMHLFALATARSGGWTFGGTMTVVGLGAAFGVLGAALYGVTRRVLPRNRHARGVVFGLAFFALCSPGIRPPRLLTFALFLPVFLSYGIALDRALTHRTKD